ncbi:MAG TPA: AAA family ATPase [candidate division Zixibacteria bacterium]|nr:AAA family ATPase [candidate division Zixibacteria bacterium]
MNSKRFDRIVIYGSPGCGKSTLANKLSEIFQVNHIHLDDVFWDPNWSIPTANEFRSRVKSVLIHDKWIIDGNYSKVRDLILPKATLAIMIDLPLFIIFWRIIARTITRNTFLKLIELTPLPKKIEETNSGERIFQAIFELSSYAIRYKRHKLKGIEEEVITTIGKENFYKFHRQEDIDNFLEKLKKKL